MLKGKADSAASTAQPESQKSFGQQIGDAVSGNQNQNSGLVLATARSSRSGFLTGFSLRSSMMDKAKDALGMNNNQATR